MAIDSEDSTYDLILKNQVDLSRIDPDYILVLLRTAVSENDTPFVRTIYHKKPELLTIDDGGSQTLWSALRNENLEIAAMLVRAGVDLSHRHPDSSTFLHWLIKKIGDLKGAEQLAELMIEYGADVNAVDIMGKRILPMTIEIHAKRVVEALLNHDAEIEDEDISRAAYGYRTAEMLPMLFAGSDVDTRKRRARNALWCYLCCQPLEEFSSEVFNAEKPSHYYKDLTLVKRIVEYALYPEQTDIDVIHILMPAVRLGHLESVELIFMIVDHQRKLQYTLQEEPQFATQLFCLASRLQKSSIARILIERGANIHDLNELDEGQYPLHEACRYNSIQNTHLFLRLGADINVTDRHGQTPFSLINTESFTHHHQLFIKHIANFVLKGCAVNESDLNRIKNHHRMQKYYEECTLELKKMKENKICKDVTFYCFFDKSLNELSKYVKRADFYERYRTSRYERRRLFPLYYTQMENIFEIAESRKTSTIIRESLSGDVSGSEIQSDLDYLVQDFYFMLHDRICRGEAGYDINLLR